MTPEIEKRIKLVQAGKVPAGYKRTKIGIVPKEWHETLLSDYLKVSKEKNKELRYSKEDVFSISGELGIVNQIELLGRSYAGASVAPYGIVKPKDIVYTKSPLKSNPYGIIKANKTGKTGIVSTLYAIFNCKNNVSSDYIQYYFESNKFVNDYLHPIVSIGAKHDMKISDENSLKGSVVFPSLPEQEKIAEILAAQDRVIELKEKLVAEKKNNKSILLKRLLNDCCFGEQRDNVKIGSVILAQTSWKKQKLGSICEKIGSGSTPKGGRTVYLDRGIPIIRSQNVLNGYLDMSDVAYISDEQHKKMSGTWVRPNDILLNITGASIGRACLVPASVQTANVNQHVCIVRLKEGVNHSYICSLILSGKVQKQIELMSAGGGRQGLNFQQIASFEVPLPSLPEQQAIAKVLSAADEEISLLQKDLEQEKLKKKSLMQLLLTGLVRVSA